MERERAYRLVVREVPEAISVAPNTIAFALEMSLPVFVVPKGARPEPAWSLREGAAGAELVLANRGNAHVRVGSLELAGKDQAPVLAVREAAYVMGGAERAWPLDLNGASLAGPLTVKADTSLGPLEAVVAPAGN